jgi:hypothetical protein
VHFHQVSEGAFKGTQEEVFPVEFKMMNCYKEAKMVFIIIHVNCDMKKNKVLEERRL